MSGYGSLGGRGGGQGSLLDKLLDLAHPILEPLSACCTPLSALLNGSSSSGAASGAQGGGAAGGTLKLNGRTLTVLKLLGEGGFSFVYLAKDRESGRIFALKKMRCDPSTPAFSLAMHEINSMRRFRSPNLIPLLDSAVHQTPDAKIVYLFLPYYAAGNVQDRINAMSIGAAERYGEAEALDVILGVVKALKIMHRWRLPDVGAKAVGQQGSQDPFGASAEVESGSGPSTAASGVEAPLIGGGGNNDDDEGDEMEDGDADGTQNPPQPRRKAGRGSAGGQGGYSMQGSAPAYEGDADAEEPKGKGGEMIPYAHRDIKPANVMLAPPSGDSRSPTPVLMDLGSCIKARIDIADRRTAVKEQDRAAEHSTMSYRAPELFDVKTGVALDEKVDIWSLGCTLYAMLHLYSPFETPSLIDSGGSIALAVLNGSWKFPPNEEGMYSERTKDIVRACLQLDPRKRPDVEKVESLVEEARRGVL